MEPLQGNIQNKHNMNTKTKFQLILEINTIKDLHGQKSPTKYHAWTHTEYN